jgi:pimeloyl-ACP methyl ester carboxylesterase
MISKINGFQMNFSDEGGGSPVLLIHGFPLCRKMWSPQLEALTKAGYRVITPDLRGFGGSNAGDTAFSMDLFADDVVALMDHLGIEKAAIGGMSMGGYILLSLLDRYIERLSAAIFIVTRSAADDGPGKERRTALANAVVSGNPSVLAEAFESVLFGPDVKEDKPELIYQVRQWMDMTCPEALVGGLTGMRDRRDYRAELGRFNIPALVIGGEKDICISPDFSKEIAAGLPDSRLHIMEGLGHVANMEAPDRFNDCLLSFLGNIEKRGRLPIFP